MSQNVKEFPKETKYLVVYTEYERGFGSKDDAMTCHTDYDASLKEADECNSKNTEKRVPDYYVVARVISDPKEFRFYRSLLPDIKEMKIKSSNDNTLKPGF
jgi:hypothetical protein